MWLQGKSSLPVEDSFDLTARLLANFTVTYDTIHHYYNIFIGIYLRSRISTYQHTHAHYSLLFLTIQGQCNTFNFYYFSAFFLTLT